jgi:hypothetical protein
MRIQRGLVVEQLPDGGCLIVDEGNQQSHALAAEAAKVWRCLQHGTFEVGAIVVATGLDATTVEATLAELETAKLIELESVGSRRQLLARAALFTGVAVGLKLVDTIATPSPAAAQSLNQTVGG